MYTVKQLSDLAGVSVRTLHYYDEIDLLNPAQVGENGYRYYADGEVYRLQQILFFRELGLSLSQIAAIIDSPAFDILAALEDHRKALQARIERMTHLIETVDNTILDLLGEIDMSKKEMFASFTSEEEEKYKQEAIQKYGEKEVKASYKRWDSYSPHKQQAIKEEGSAIYTDWAAAVDQPADSPAVQAIVARWHEHLRYFYEPSVARLRGLSGLYVDSPDFANKFRAIHPDLPEFMQESIAIYCDGLDDAS